MREFTKDRETVRDRKHSVRPPLVTEELKNVSAISLQMINQIAIFCKTWGVVWSITLRKKRWFKKLHKTIIVWTGECMTKIYKNSYNVRMSVQIGLVIVLENEIVHILKLQIKKMHF